MAYIGVDLHKDRFTAKFKTNINKDNLESYYLNPDGIRKFKGNLKKDDYVFLEASTPTFAFSDLIKRCVKETIVVDPFQFKVIVDSGKKTDKVDAGTLAKMGKYHVETGKDFLPEVCIPDKKIRKLRSLFTTYQLINREITMVKNRIYSIFRQNLKPYTKRYIFGKLMHDLESCDLDEEYKIQVKVLFEILDTIEKKKEEIKRKILIEGKSFMRDIDLLVSIKGISVFIALGLISDYDTINRFKNAKKFARYLRSTPKTETSNKRVKNGKTQKSGRKLSFSFMLQGMNHFVIENHHLAKFYFKIKKTKGGGKARTALIRKMLVTIYHMLKKREYYWFMDRELHNRKMKEYKEFLEKNH
jgi:transposase